MDLLQLRYFCKVAQYENITKAAEELYIPQPAMSKMISKLEKELGVNLFDRNKNVLYLNDKGRDFKSHVENALAELDFAVEDLKSVEGIYHGTMKLLVNENQRFIQGCVSDFSKAHPEVSFHVCHDYRLQSIKDYDIGIVSEEACQQGVAIPLVKEELALAVEENCKYATREYVEFKELEKEKFISTAVNSSLHSLVVEYGKHAGFHPMIPFTFDDPYFVRKYVSERMGVAVVPTVSWRGRFRANTIIVPINHPRIYSTSYLVWNDRKYHAPCVAAFRDYVIKEALKIEGNMVKIK